MARSAEIPLRAVALAVFGLAGALLERAVDRYISPAPVPITLEAQGHGRINPNSSFEPVYAAWMRLQNPAYVGTDDIFRSFVEVMQAMGYQVGNPETFGSAPRFGRAGRAGLYIRAVPSTLPEFGRIASITWGDGLSWTGEFPVSNPDKSRDIFGLTKKGFVRLRTHNPDGTINWHVEAANRK